MPLLETLIDAHHLHVAALADEVAAHTRRTKAAAVTRVALLPVFFGQWSPAVVVGRVVCVVCAGVEGEG